MENKFLKTGIAPLFLAAGLTACGGGSSGGSEEKPSQGGDNKETPSVLTQSEARDVIAQNLDNSQKGVDAKVGFSPVENITFDVIGEYGQNGRSVGVVYDRELENTGVPSQGGVDYVLEIDKGSEKDIKSNLENSLDLSVFGPVVEESKDLGDYNVADRVNGGLNVRSSTPSSLTANCEVYDSNGDKLADFDLQYYSGNHKIPTNSGFGLGADEYQASCSFVNANGVKTTLEDAFKWQVVNSENTAPVVEGTSIDNESSLEKYNGNIRDINNSISVSYDFAKDKEDDALGKDLTIEGYVKADGETNTYSISNGSFSFNPNQLGGLEAEIGVRAVDSQGATGKSSITRVFDKNNSPTTSSIKDIYRFDQNSGIKTLVEKSDYVDQEGDSISLENATFDTLILSGNYKREIIATDSYNASNSDVTTIEITQGSF